MTYEHRPLSVFGDEAAAAVAELLEDAGRPAVDRRVRRVRRGRPAVGQHGRRAAGRPRRRAPAPGRARDRRAARPTPTGFVTVDEHGRVAGLDDVYAAGDMTTRPLKQGGLATQQADVAAAAIAARRRRRRSRPRPTGPSLRAMLLTGGARATSAAPPARPATPPTTRRGGRRTRSPGRELAPYLTAHPELRLEPATQRREGAACPRLTPLRVLVAGGGVAAARDRRSRCMPSPATASRIELLAPAGEYVERPSSVLSPFSGAPAPRVPLDGLPALGVIRHRGALADGRRRRARGAHDRRRTPRLRPAGRRHRRAQHRRRPWRDDLPRADQRRRGRGGDPRAESRIIFVAPRRRAGCCRSTSSRCSPPTSSPTARISSIVTHEPRPLDVFGPIASDALARLLDRAGIEFIGRTRAVECVGDALVTEDG